MRPASAPIPSQLRTAVKLIMPLPAEASARKPMPTTAATGLRFKPRMAARNLLPIVLPNAKRLIPIIAETAMLSPRLTAASRFTETVSQSAKWLIRTTVITGPRQSPLVRQTQPALILPTVLPKSNLGPVTQAMRNPVTLALLKIRVRVMKKRAAVRINIIRKRSAVKTVPTSNVRQPAAHG